MNMDKIKSEIIYELLFNQIEFVSEEYKNYLKVDSDMSNDENMYVFIDSIYKNTDFNNINVCELVFMDFKNECDNFIKELEEKIPMKHLVFSDNYHVHHKNYDDSSEYYDGCELHFKILNE